MRLLHPFMPFITEEIWQNLPHNGESITTAAWPTVNETYTDHDAAEQMKLLVQIIRSVRNIRAEVNTPLSKKINMILNAHDDKTLATLESNKGYIERFCNPETLTIALNIEAPEKAMTAVVTGAEIFLPLQGLINIEEEIARLEKELDKLNKEVERVEKKLSNEKFVSKAPANVVEEERTKQKDYMEKRAIVQTRLEEIKAL
jgi:valyl-tRNA synthetase